MDLETAVQRVCSGDASAFQEVIRATRKQLYRVAARLLGDLEEAEDVLQESYVRAYNELGLGRFKARSTTQTWLYRIVINCSLDWLRARRRREARYEVPVSIERHNSQLEARMALRELSSWLADLPLRQRTAVVLKELEGLSIQEISQLMDCTVGAVEQYIVRARAALRARREDEENGTI